MLDPTQERTLLEEIESRQDEVLMRLDELNGRIEEVLRRELAGNKSEVPAPSPA
jgi:hypothetical protein